MQIDKKKLTILGSTGVVGNKCLDLVRLSPDSYDVVSISGNLNVGLLVEQAMKFRPKFVSVGSKDLYQEVYDALSPLGIEVGCGKDGLIEAASYEADIGLSAISGIEGLPPSLELIKNVETLAIANKETIVCAGSLLLDYAEYYCTKIIPVDSEHNALYQVANFFDPMVIEKIHITASGGPFLDLSMDDLVNVTPEMAVKHPNWVMGKKISIDSATLMNKGLELIEANYLFPKLAGKFGAVIHKQSIAHCIIEMCNLNSISVMSYPDMAIPIAHSIGFTEYEKLSKDLDFSSVSNLNLNFNSIDEERFRAIPLAFKVLNMGGIMPLVLNSANEEAVDLFLRGEIGFADIVHTVERVVDHFVDYNRTLSLNDIMEIDGEVREFVKQKVFVGV